MIQIIKATNENVDELTEMGLELWPNNEYEYLKNDFIYNMGHLKNIIYLAKSNDGYMGFIHMSIRNDFVEGSNTSPVGYLEGIYVKPDFRKMGVARDLYHAGIEWSKSKRCSQVGSDVGIDNNLSYDFHTKMGFKEANRIICFITNI